MRLGKIISFFLACIIFSTSFIAIPVTSEEAVMTLQEEIIISVDSTNLRFSPSEVTIVEGQTVRFFWDGELLEHNAVEMNGFFDSGEPGRNVDYSFTFDVGTNGVYEFVCEPHELANMVGKITVNQAPPIDVIEDDELKSESEPSLNLYFVLAIFGAICSLANLRNKKNEKGVIMEILNLNQMPILKEDQIIVPLFTLDSLLLPGDEMMMRVFEPRYKQMLDDVTLGDLPYGHVMSNPSMPDINGCSVPYDVGTLVKVNDLQEQGTNLLYNAIGGGRFRIVALIESALEPEFFNAVFASVDDLTEQYIDEVPTGKLYVRGVIEMIPELKGDIEKSKWDNLLSLWMLYIEHIAEINEMDVNDFDIESEVRNMFLKSDQEHIWILASLVLDSLDSQILALKATHAEEICSIIESNIQSKLNAIRVFRQSNE